MTPFTFLKQIARLVAAGDGFRKDSHIDLASVRTAAGLILTGATVPTIAATETNGLAIVAAASGTASGSFVWTVPGDYDQQADEAKIRVLANMAGATDDAVTLTATVYRKRAGTALSADLNPTADSSAVPASASPTDDAAWLTIDISGESLRPGDVLTINLVASAHTNDALQIWGIAVRYKSCLVLYDADAR
jgi:hypothetical protein